MRPPLSGSHFGADWVRTAGLKKSAAAVAATEAQKKRLIIAGIVNSSLNRDTLTDRSGKAEALDYASHAGNAKALRYDSPP
jgi:hypothetical protein